MPTFITPEEYEVWKQGEIFPILGTTPKQDALAVRLTALFVHHVGSHRVHSSSMPVVVPENGGHAHCELSVVTTEPAYANAPNFGLMNPTLVVDIVSSRRGDPRGGSKPRVYRGLPSVEEILLVTEDEFDVELYRRQDDGTWILFHAVGLESSVELASIGYTLRLAELYENVG